ncbi:MAG: ABC transporter permease, partial [Deltaproteobacteria bacterium]|nr:ABC transporter permease [Deltaproteobacteria bacterium]
MSWRNGQGLSPMRLLLAFPREFQEFILEAVLGLGKWCRFVWGALVWSVRPPWRLKNIFRQMEFIGVQSLPIILLTSLFTGMVFALQVGKTFAIFKMQNLVGSTVGLA